MWLFTMVTDLYATVVKAIIDNTIWTQRETQTPNICGIIYVILMFLFIDWLKVYHVIKNYLTILQKLLQSRK